MNRAKYYQKIKDKKILNSTNYKFCYISSKNDYFKAKVAILPIEKFTNYVEGSINFPADYIFLVRPVFLFKLTHNQINYDIITLNHNLEILDLHRNCNRGFSLDINKNPVSLLILNANAIDFYDFKIGEKFKLCKYS